MESLKTKSLEDIEQRMANLDANSFRYHVLTSARNFKTSWIELGRALYSVWKDKLYKQWGYATFEAYTSREVGIKKQTSMKLLRSYYFLEQEEPQYLKDDYTESGDPVSLPSYESVNLLRMAKNSKRLDGEDYADLKKNVLHKGRDAKELKKDLTALIRQREELEPEEAREKKRLATIRRFLGVLRSLKEEIAVSKMLSTSVIHEAEKLISKLEAELS